ncbi:MAG: uracil-DNA glycosylase family protein [Candidatus Cryptobacteroides sp.]
MQQTESHPLEPFLPSGARILMLGSFPPKRERWSMEFFYPNWINDMWRIMGIVFFGDKDHFADNKEKRFDRQGIMDFCQEKGIALYDTATEVIRLRDNASDKFLEVVSPTDIIGLLDRIPGCRAVVTTGQKATDILTGLFGCEEPAVGSMSEAVIPGTDRTIRFWRMPSSSRAYPLPVGSKAEHYRRMFGYENMV